MKKRMILTIAAALILGGTSFGLAQMAKDKTGTDMKKQMQCPKTYGMGMHGMMGKKMIATEDGGVVVMICNKLYKYDKDLNLKKEVEIPIDMEHMKKMQMKMKEMGTMGGM